MMSNKGLILWRYIAENNKNINISQNKTSRFIMIFTDKIANQHGEARCVILTLFYLIIASSIESLIMIP